jgi:hypothetical protein
MSFSGFFSQADANRRRDALLSGTSAGPAQALRRQHELASAELRARLPFQWEPGVVRSRYQGPPIFEHGPAAVHIWLQEPLGLDNGRQARRRGDWLCMASLDESTGELRYEGQAAPLYADGTGGPGANYEQMPTCKKCLKKAGLFSRPTDG